MALLVAAPVHCHVPLYRGLAADPRLDFTAIFASSAGIRPSDIGYAHPVAWDGDFLDGYHNVFLRRAERNPISGSSAWALHDFDIVPHLRRERYDVLCLLGYRYVTHALAAVAQRALGGGLAFREEQTLLHRRGALKASIKAPLLRALFSQGPVMYIGTRNREWFTHYGVPPQRLFFTPYTVDNDELQRRARELHGQRADLRARFGIESDAGPVVLAAMRFIPKKQPLFLLEAFRRVRNEARCSLLVVGSGPLESAMRAVVRLEGIPDVHFAGFLNRSEIPQAYACADVSVLASLRHETWGLVVNEAMNFGLPLVVSDKVGCAADLVEHGHNGFVASARNVSDFAERMLTLVRDEDLRRRCGDASLRRISEWHPSVTVDGTIEAIAATVGPRRWQRAAPTA